MAPTIQDSQRERREKSDFVCRVKYNNSLPDIPFDAKFITYPFEGNRFIHYKPTSLERSYKHDLLTEPDLGVTIDLIDPDTYSISNNELHPADEKLLEEEFTMQADHKRQRQHTKSVTWLRKTQYISTEFNRFQTCNDMVETKVGFNVKKKMKGIDLYKDREAQIQSIEGSFEAAKKPITAHHANPRLKPVDIMPVFPDFSFWHMPCAHVIFDTEPTPRGKADPASIDEMSHAMIRGMEDESGDQFVAYFLPSDDTLRKRKREEADPSEIASEDESDYKLAREYNWSVKNKASSGYEENYFFALRENEGAFYNELQTRVKLNKRRAKGGAGGISSAVSKLVVRNREPTEAELNLQKSRLSQLENAALEEELDEDEDEPASPDSDQVNADDVNLEEQDEAEDRKAEDAESNEEGKKSDNAVEVAEDQDDEGDNDLGNELFGSSSSEDEGDE
eukprot:gene3503-1887_t